MKPQLYNIYSHKTFYIFILSICAVFVGTYFSTPVYAEETTTSTPDIVTSTPDIVEEIITTSTPSDILSEETTPLSSTDIPLVTQHFTLRYDDQMLFDDDISMPIETTFEYVEDGNTFTTTTDQQSALALLLAADAQSDNFSVGTIDYYPSLGTFLVSCIYIPTADACMNNWQYVVDGIYPSGENSGMAQFIFSHENSVVYMYHGERYVVETDATEYVSSDNIPATLYEYDFSQGVYIPTNNSEYTLSLIQSEGWSDTLVSTCIKNEDGTYTCEAPHDVGTYSIGLTVASAWGDYYWPKTSIDIVYQNKLILWYNGELIFDDYVPLPESTTFDYHIQGEENIFSTSTAAQTVFTLVKSVGEISDAFDVSDIAYYDQSWGNGFYISCIDVETSSGRQQGCDNWQYVVNGSYPYVGMDQYDVADGVHTIYLYYGDQYAIQSSKTSYNTTENIDATLYEFDVITGLYATSTDASIQLDVYQTMSDVTSLVFASSTVDDQGRVSFSNPGVPGTYTIGLNSYGWYWPHINVEVTATTEETATPSTGNGGTTTEQTEPADTFVTKAFEFLNTQIDNGSFLNNPFYTDWAAIAYGSYSGNTPQKNDMRSYFANTPITSNVITDYERRAMALMALGINPYTGTSINYIEKIVASYDGTQIGDADLYNDDIFGVIALYNVGYTYQDEIIQNSIDYILSYQHNINGSFSGTDITAAAIQALQPFASESAKISSAITSAKKYLQTMQTSNGGFKDSTQSSDANIFSTSWTMQAITALGESPANWTTNGNTGNAYILSQQQSDGSIQTPSHSTADTIWATSSAIPAYLGTSWHTILTDFTKQSILQNPTIIQTTPTHDVVTSTLDIKISTSTEDIVLEQITTSTLIGEDTLSENEDVILSAPQEILGEKIEKITSEPASKLLGEDKVIQPSKKVSIINPTPKSPDASVSEQEILSNTETPATVSDTSLSPKKGRFATMVHRVATFILGAFKKLF